MQCPEWVLTPETPRPAVRLRDPAGRSGWGSSSPFLCGLLSPTSLGSSLPSVSFGSSLPVSLKSSLLCFFGVFSPHFFRVFCPPFLWGLLFLFLGDLLSLFLWGSSLPMSLGSSLPISLGSSLLEATPKPLRHPQVTPQPGPPAPQRRLRLKMRVNP